VLFSMDFLPFFKPIADSLEKHSSLGSSEQSYIFQRSEHFIAYFRIFYEDGSAVSMLESKRKFSNMPTLSWLLCAFVEQWL